MPSFTLAPGSPVNCIIPHRMKFEKLLLIVVLFLSALKTLGFREHLTLSDFRVYEIAATLVREHHSPQIYNGADQGVDPQLRWAEPGSEFGKAAQALGIPQTRLYVYPPVLADLLVPLSFLDARRAGYLWTGFNLIALAATIWILLTLVEVRSVGLVAVGIVMGVATFDPVLECIVWGQILLFLLLLWTLGTWCYVRDWKAASALLFALATAIKLTPLILVVPMVLWRDWRWLRTYIGGLAVVLFAVLAINGEACLKDCFFNVVPAMANGVPLYRNRSLLAACQVIYATLHGADPTLPTPVVTVIPQAVLTIGKVLNIVSLGVAAWLVAIGRKNWDPKTRGIVLALFAMLSVAIAPVSWEHAYSICLLTLVLLWAEVFQVELPRAYVVLLAASTLEMNWLLLSYLPRHLSHGLVNSIAVFSPVYFSLALVFVRLAGGSLSDRFARRKILFPVS
jgi:hypothetical protein